MSSEKNDNAGEAPVIQTIEIPVTLLDELDCFLEGDLSVKFAGSGPMQERLNRLSQQLQSDLLGRLDEIVAQSSFNMESTISAARILKNVRDTSGRSQSIAAAAEQLVASVNQIADQSKSAAVQATTALDFASGGLEQGNHASAAMSAITDSIQAASERIQRLSQASQDIGSIVDAIADIAKKTNLLALNATIEAARAGDAGRGFAVVASEVKALSEQTANATEQIKMNIDKLRAEMKSTVTAMDQGCEEVSNGERAIGTLSSAVGEIHGQVQEIDTRMSTIAHILEEQDAAATEVSQSIGDISLRTTDSTENVNQLIDRMDELQGKLQQSTAKFDKVNLAGKVIKLAKADHVAWKKRLVDMSVNRLTIDPNELADHRSCRLGKWYYSDAAEDYRNKPAFRDLEVHHERVHNAGMQAAACFEQGRLDEALQHIETVETASSEVVRYLSALE